MDLPFKKKEEKERKINRYVLPWNQGSHAFSVKLVFCH